MKLPGLHELQAFEVASRLASFSRAAKELHVTESAISHRIRALEEDLGTLLFVRGYRSVSLTAAGEAYRHSIRDAFDALAEAHRRVSALRKPSVQVAVPAALGARTLGPLFAQYHLDHPEVALRVSMWDPRVVPSASRVDVTIVYGDQPLPGFARVATIPQSLCAIAAPGYLTAVGIRDPQGMRRATLLQHPALSWRDWFRAAGAVAAASVTDGPVYEDGTMMLESAVCGLGAALCPELAVAPWIRGGQLTRCFDVCVPTIPYVVHCSERSADVETAWGLANWLAAQLAAGQGEPPVRPQAGAISDGIASDAQ